MMQRDLFGDPAGLVDVGAELEDLAIRLGTASMWSREASHPSRGLMISLLTQAGYADKEQQLTLLGKLLQYTVCITAPYTELSSRKAITQSVVSTLIDWMKNPNTAKATVRWPATKALDAVFYGQVDMPSLPANESEVSYDQAQTEILAF